MKLDKHYIYFAIGGAVLAAIIVTSSILLKRRKVRQVDLSLFDSPDAPGSGKCIDRRLVSMLLKLERRTGYPVLKNINSGVRTDAHNRKVGGVYSSSHKIPVCKAVDISTPSKFLQEKLVRAARNIGFKRIGIGSNFVHLDIDTSKSQYVAWGYPKGNPPPFNPFV